MPTKYCDFTPDGNGQRCRNCGQFVPTKLKTIAMCSAALPLRRRALSFMRSLVKHAANLFRQRTRVEQAVILLEHCGACELRDGKSCSECGCYLPVKTAMRSEHCPKGKW